MTIKTPEGRFRSLGAESWKPENVGDIVQGEIWEFGEKAIKTDLVPYVQLRNPETEDITEVLLSSFELTKLFYSHKMKEEYWLAIKYMGESKTIRKGSNFLKHFQYYMLDADGNEIIVKDEDCQGVFNEILDGDSETHSATPGEHPDTDPKVDAEDDLPVGKHPKSKSVATG